MLLSLPPSSLVNKLKPCDNYPDTEGIESESAIKLFEKLKEHGFEASLSINPENNQINVIESKKFTEKYDLDFYTLEILKDIGNIKTYQPPAFNALQEAIALLEVNNYRLAKTEIMEALSHEQNNQYLRKLLTDINFLIEKNN